jgi:hypothetical protein
MQSASVTAIMSLNGPQCCAPGHSSAEFFPASYVQAHGDKCTDTGIQG